MRYTGGHEISTEILAQALVNTMHKNWYPFHLVFSIIGATRCFTLEEVKNASLAKEISRKRETKLDVKKTAFNSNSNPVRGNNDYHGYRGRGQMQGNFNHRGKGSRARSNCNSNSNMNSVDPRLSYKRGEKGLIGAFR